MSIDNLKSVAATLNDISDELNELINIKEAEIIQTCIGLVVEVDFDEHKTLRFAKDTDGWGLMVVTTQGMTRLVSANRLDRVLAWPKIPELIDALVKRGIEVTEEIGGIVGRD